MANHYLPSKAVLEYVRQWDAGFRAYRANLRSDNLTPLAARGYRAAEFYAMFNNNRTRTSY